MEHVEQMLRELFGDIAKQNHYENCNIQLKAISSGGANYTSELYIATISSLNKEDLELFAKVAVIGEEIRATIPAGIFNIEYFVYSELANKFKQIEDEHEVSNEDRYCFSKYYGYKPDLFEEVLVLENLAARGFMLYDRMKSVDWSYASKAVESLAKFHAVSMAYGEKYPEKLKFLSKSFSQIETGFEAMMAALKNMVSVALNAVKPENKEKLAKFFDDEVNNSMVYYTQPRRKPVIIHGDYRPSNLLYKVNKDDTMEVIPVDYQTIRPGCMASDLVFFIFSSSDQEFRAHHYEQLVEHYYQQLCRSLRALHFDSKKVYPREDFEAELREVLPYGIVITVMLLPIVMVQPEDAPNIHSGNIFENMGNTKTSSLYPDRLNGAIDDFVRWGII